MLIATLLSLMLIVGLALTVQAAALANTKALKALAGAQSEDLAKDSIRQLVRPVVALAMIDPDDRDALPLNGEDIPIEFRGAAYKVSVQDVNGLVHPDLTPKRVADHLLPEEWRTLAKQVSATPMSASLVMRASQAGASLVQLNELYDWLSAASVGTRLTKRTLAQKYQKSNQHEIMSETAERQTKTVLQQTKRVVE